MCSTTSAEASSFGSATAPSFGVDSDDATTSEDVATAVVATGSTFAITTVENSDKQKMINMRENLVI